MAIFNLPKAKNLKNNNNKINNIIRLLLIKENNNSKTGVFNIKLANSKLLAISTKFASKKVYKIRIYQLFIKK